MRERLLRGLRRERRLAQAKWCGRCADHISRALWLRYDGAGGSLAHRWALLGAEVALLIAEVLGTDPRTTTPLHDMLEWALSPYDPDHDRPGHG